MFLKNIIRFFPFACATSYAVQCVYTPSFLYGVNTHTHTVIPFLTVQLAEKHFVNLQAMAKVYMDLHFEHLFRLPAVMVRNRWDWNRLRVS